MLTKIELESLRKEAELALAPIAEKYNCEVHAGNITYSDVSATLSVKFDSYIKSNYCPNCGTKMEELHAQPENKPLTLEELREMDGEPVYIDDWFQDFHGWELSDDAEDYFDERDVAQYGSQWVAYRRKPECEYSINYCFDENLKGDMRCIKIGLTNL